MQHRKTENAVSILAGTLVGAGVMFLLDPNSGARRRQKIRNYATDKAHEYSAKAKDYADQVAKHVRTAHEHLSKAQDISDHVTEYGNDLWNQVQGLGNKLSTRSKELLDSRQPRRPSMALPVTASAVGCCALGLGLMYMLDPDRGRERRQWLMGSIGSCVRSTGQSFRHLGQMISGRGKGEEEYPGVRYPSAGGPAASEQLVDHIRAEIGKRIQNDQRVQIIADRNGTVTLSGTIVPGESEMLVAAVEAMDGVNLVINRMEVSGAPAEGVPLM